MIEQATKEGSTEEIQAAYFDDSIHNYYSEEGSPESMHILILLLSTTIRLYLSDHITPLPYPKECKHFDYGLQYKIDIKRIFTLFFTNMVVEGV